MRILGLDYGSRTVGVAVSDPLGITAQPVEIVRRKAENKLRQTLARIEELVKEYQAELLVLGLPKNMNNTLGERAERTLEFKDMLERRTGLPVVMWDERLTTVAANRAMMEGGVRRENRGQYVDCLLYTSAPEQKVYYLRTEGMEQDEEFRSLLVKYRAESPAQVKTCLLYTSSRNAWSWARPGLFRFPPGGPL